MNEEIENYSRSREDVVQSLCKKGSYKYLLYAKCCECIYDEGSKGTWRKQVEECTSKDCPIYPKRPVSESHG